MNAQQEPNQPADSAGTKNDLYLTKVTATGGRHGHIRSHDGLLDLKLALPRELGGKGDATNPEQLFAGGLFRLLRKRALTREP
jgi:organic hydroperoxide reductase OsmC/OhrA